MSLWSYFSLLTSLDLEEPYEDMCSPLVDDVIDNEEIIRKASADTLATALKHHQEYITTIIDLLLQKYEEKSEVKNRNKSRLLFSSAEMFKKPLWQTVGAVCSGSTLFASILNLLVLLGNYLQQMTSADDIFRCIFFLSQHFSQSQQKSSSFLVCYNV